MSVEEKVYKEVSPPKQEGDLLADLIQRISFSTGESEVVVFRPIEGAISGKRRAEVIWYLLDPVDLMQGHWGSVGDAPEWFAKSLFTIYISSKAKLLHISSKGARIPTWGDALHRYLNIKRTESEELRWFVGGFNIIASEKESKEARIEERGAVGLVNNALDTIVIRPHDWDQLDEILDSLAQIGVGYELLGFGCISIAKADADSLNKRGYKVEQVDFERVLDDEKEQERYIIQRNRYYGLEI